MLILSCFFLNSNLFSQKIIDRKFIPKVKSMEKMAFVVDVTIERIKVASKKKKDIHDIFEEKDYHSSEDLYNQNEVDKGKKRREIVLVVGIGDTQEYMRLLGCRLPDLLNKRMAFDAVNFIKDKIGNKFIRFKTDKIERDTDGRLLAYVHYGSENIMLNRKLLEYGFCFYDSSYPSMYQTSFMELSNFHRLIDLYVNFVAKLDYLIYQGKMSEAGSLYAKEEISSKAEQNFFHILSSSPTLEREYYSKLERRRKQLGLLY